MKQKLLLFLLALVGSIGAWAETTISLGNSANIKANATFYKNGAVQTGSAWCDKAVYRAVTLAGAISSYSGYLDAKSSATLTISVPAGATIKGYSFGIQMKDNLTCTANDVALNNSSPVTVSASSLSTNSVTINFTNVTGNGSNECLLELSNFTVNVETYNVESLKTDGYYYIHNSANSDKYVSNELKCTTTGSRQLFKISKAIRNGAECYTIYNLSTRKFAKYAENSNGADISGDDAGDNSYWTLTFDGNHWTICPQGTNSYSWNFYGGLTDGNPVKLWNTSDGNSKWLLEEATSLTSYAIDGDYEFYTVTNNRNSDKVVSSEYKCASSNPGVFRIQKVSGQSYYTMYNMSSNKYVNWTDANSGANKLTEADNTSSNSYWDILDQLDSNNIIATICPHGTTTLSWNFYGGASDGTAIGLFSNTDGGSTWRLAKQTYNAEYKLFYNNTELTDYSTSNITVTKADPISATPESWKRDFCTLKFYSDASLTTELSMLPASDVTVYVKATWTGPFEISADYASAHWYDMAVRGDYYVTSDRVDGDNALAPIEANALGLAEDAYQWAFVGNPWNLKLYNKYKGSSKVYSWSSTDNGSIPAFVDVAEGNSWWIRQNTTGTNTFQLTIPSYGYQVNQFGGATGSLKIWADARQNDVGSAFKVIEVPDDFAEYAAAEIQPYVTATGYFALTDAVKASIGWNDSYATTCPFATYKAMKETLLANVNNINSYNLPATGYYRFTSKMYNTYMGLTTDKVLDNFSENSAATIVKLTKGTGENAGKYTIALQDRYIQTLNRSVDAPLTDDAASAEWFAPTVVEIGYGSFGDADATVNDGYSYVHAASSAGGNKVVGWVANAEASKWTIEDADDFDLTIGETGYSTLWVPFPVTIPSGLEVYTGSLNGNYLHLDEVTDYIPANTAVVLKGNADDYKFLIYDGDVAAITGNVLLGSNGNVTGGTDIYALSTLGGTEPVGFYPVGNITIPANKAYLNTSAGVKGFTFLFDDDATGLDAVNGQWSMVNDQPIFNLAGQRINKMQNRRSTYVKGINIVNGKKVMVK